MKRSTKNQTSKWLPSLEGSAASKISYAILLAAVCSVGSVDAQQINPAVGQTAVIDASTTPSPIAGVNAAGTDTRVLGTNAVIERNSASAVVTASGGGVVELTGGSISNQLTGTATVKPAGISIGNGGTVRLWDLSVTVTASGGPTYNAPSGVSIASGATAAVEASNVDLMVSGSTTSAEAGAALRILSNTGTATLTNGSTVTANGAYVYGLFAGNGGLITSTGTTISTTGANSIAVYSNASNIGGSTILLTNGSVSTDGARAYALYGAKQSNTTADVTASISATGVMVSTSADNTHAVFADRGSSIFLTDGSVTSTGANASAVRAQAVNGSTSGPTKVTARDVAIKATGHASTGVTVDAGASAEIDGGSVKTEGYEGYALYANGAGSTIMATDVEIETKIRAAHGAHVTDGGQILLEGGSINVLAGTTDAVAYPGGFTYGLSAMGAGSQIRSEAVAITTAQQWSYGVYSANGAEVDVIGGTVNTSGERAHGLSAAGGAGVINSTADIATTGNRAVGAQAYSESSVGVTDSSFVNLTGGSVTTSGDYANGLAAVKEGSVLTSSANVTTSGLESHGAVADRKGVLIITGGDILTKGHAAKGVRAIDGGVASVSDATVTTERYEATGLSAEGAGSEIEASNVTVNTTIRAAHGAQATGGASISLTGGSITALAGTENSTEYPAGFTYGLYAIGAGSSITSTDVAIETKEQWSYGVHARENATVTLNGGSVSTSGYRSHGLSASGAGGAITGETSIVTNGLEAHGAQAYNDGTTEAPETSTITLTGGTILTLGAESHGVMAVKTGSTVTSAASISTVGANSHGAVADRNGVVNLTGGMITTESATSAGLAVFNGGTISATNTGVFAAGDAIRADFNNAVENSVAAITVDSGSLVTGGGAEPTLLRVNRADSAAGGSGVVQLAVKNGGVASGNIVDAGTKTSGYLDIRVEAGGQLTANSITGYRGLLVDGKLLGAGTIGVLANQSLTGSGYVNHNVTVDGGTLSSSLIINGKVSLVGAEVAVADVTTSISLDAGKELVSDTVGSTSAPIIVDVSEGTASIGTLSDGATLKSGNWGATIENVTGGTIDAGQGSVNVTNITGGAVTSGTLIVNNGGGSGDVGALAVGESATIGGNGTVQADTSIAGNLNPGNSPGTLNFAGDLTLQDTTNTTIEIGGLLAGTEYDVINITGSVVFDGTLTLSLVSDFQPLLNQTYQIFNFVEGNSLGYFDQVVFSQEGYEGLFDAQTGVLTVSAVPEPGTWVLIIAGGLFLVALRRRVAARA